MSDNRVLPAPRMYIVALVVVILIGVITAMVVFATTLSEQLPPTPMPRLEQSLDDASELDADSDFRDFDPELLETQTTVDDLLRSLDHSLAGIENDKDFDDFSGLD